MNDAILVLNAGSSSIKFSLYQADAEPSARTLLCDGEMEGIGHRIHLTAHDASGRILVDQQFDKMKTHEQALAELLPWLEQQFEAYRLIAAGHRIVHGGPRYTVPMRIDAAVLRELRRLIPLAPLHQPNHIAAIEALTDLHPFLPQIACFDTAFHSSQPDVASAFALPRRLAEEGVRRYGFHGLSYEYIAGVLPEVMGASLAELRVVVAHLGSGASMCALYGRRSIATTMGFTALDGLPMSRRCGAIDPGVILYLLEQKGMSAAHVSDMLYHDSGLFGVSGISDDVRVLLASRDPHAAEAIDLFVYRIVRELGSLAAALGGLDALVFTAGIGEHQAEIRRRVCTASAWLGLTIDDTANQSNSSCISKAGGRASAWVVPTNEDLMIARHSWKICQTV